MDPSTERSAEEPLDNVTSQLPALNSTFELVDGVGHFSHLECPEILATKILGRLAE